MRLYRLSQWPERRSREPRMHFHLHSQSRGAGPGECADGHISFRAPYNQRNTEYHTHVLVLVRSAPSNIDLSRIPARHLTFLPMHAMRGPRLLRPTTNTLCSLRPLLQLSSSPALVRSSSPALQDKWANSHADYGLPSMDYGLRRRHFGHVALAGLLGMWASPIQREH